MCISDGNRIRSKRGCAGDANEAGARWGIAVERSAFSLIEMLVAVAILLVLAALLAGAVTKAQSKARLTGCIQHLRQLQLGWQMYADDHAGALPGNAAVKTGEVWRGVAESWAGPNSAVADTDSRFLEIGQLWRSGAIRSPEIFRCPGDRSVSEGGRRARSRSYSLNGNLGGRTNEQQACVQFLGEIPEPSALLAFVDEHEDSIDDGHFLVWPEPDER